MADNFDVTQELPEEDCTRQDIYNLLSTMVPKEDLVNGDVLQILSNKITAGDRLPFWRKYTKTYTDLSVAAAANDIELFQLPAGGVIHAVKMKTSTAFGGGALATYKLSLGVTGALDQFIKDFDAHAAVGDTNFRTAWAPLFDAFVPAAFNNADGEISGISIPAFGNVNGAIAALTISASYNQTEVTNLRNACETLGDDVRGFRDAVLLMQTAMEELADDCRALRAKLASVFTGRIGGESQGAAASIRLSAVGTGANLSAANAGAVDVWVLWSTEV